MTSLFGDPVLTQYGLEFQPTFPTPRGSTFNPSLDGKRLGDQMQRVYTAMLSGQWMTLREIAAITHDPEASISARIRDIPKVQHGPNRYEKRRRGDAKRGCWEYRICLESHP